MSKQLTLEGKVALVQGGSRGIGAAIVRRLAREARAVGGLFNPTACVTVADGLVTISMAWEGYQAISNPSANTCSNACANTKPAISGSSVRNI